MKQEIALVNEVAVSGVVQNELKNANKNLKTLQKQRYDNLRMAEINDYYSEKYSTQTNVMKTIVYFCIPIIIFRNFNEERNYPKKHSFRYYWCNSGNLYFYSNNAIY